MTPWPHRMRACHVVRRCGVQSSLDYFGRWSALNELVVIGW